MRVIRVAVCGDAGTGKTSLISTSTNDVFDTRPPPILPPTRLPPEFTPDRVPLLVTDTSSRLEDQQFVDLIIQQSDVVVVCFDAMQQATLDSIRGLWYPRIQRLNPDVPVIMACCKADRLVDERETAVLRERVERAVSDLPHVEVCLNCSARTLRMVADVFYYALKSVLYPLQPLYDRLEKRLRPLCVRALKRVFVMCDGDKDGALSDGELNAFQLTCFGMALTEQELQNVKQIVLSKMPNGVTERGLSLEGFLFLHVLFIERGRLESTWAVLRKFGYNDELRLSDDLLDRAIAFNLPQDQVYELSGSALDFLTGLFTLYDDDGDGLLTWQQVESMFSTIPPPVWQGDAWSRLLVPGTTGAAHGLEGFTLKWRYAALQDPRTAVAHLLYLGYGDPAGADARQLLQRGARRVAHKTQLLAARSSFQCLVFGASGCGKSSLVKALAGRPEQQVSGPVAAVALVRGPDDRERALVMTEVPEDVAQQVITAATLAGGAPATLTAPATAGAAAPGGSSTGSPLPDLNKCDVALFVFDSSSAASFATAVQLMTQVSTLAGETLPCVLVAAKDDLGMPAELQPEVARVSSELCLPRPLATSVEGAAGADGCGPLFHTLVAAALAPEGHVPETEARKARKRFVKQVKLAAGAGVVAALSAAVVYRWWSSSSAQHASAPASGSSLPAASSNTGNSQGSGSGAGGADVASSALSLFSGLVDGKGPGGVKAASVCERSAAATATGSNNAGLAALLLGPAEGDLLGSTAAVAIASSARLATWLAGAPGWQ